MAYIVQQDLIDRFGEAELKELADRDSDGAIDTEVVAAAIADADRLIDGYVGKKYDLPLAAAPAILQQLSADIARYKLHKDAPTETVRNNYQDALRQLRDIAAGNLVLDVAGAEPARAGGTVQFDAPDRVFTNDTLKGL